MIDKLRSIYQTYANIRQNTVEQKWKANSEAYRSIRDGYWADNTWKTEEGRDWRSKTFVNITHQKVLAAYSVISDMFFQNGKIPFTIDTMDEDIIDDNYRKLLFKIENDIEKIIRDVNVDRAFSKCILSACIFGECCAKFAVRAFSEKVFEKVKDNIVENKIETLKPVMIFIPVWDIFFDPSFDDIAESPAIIHRQYLSKSELQRKIGKPYFLDDKIKAFLETNKTGFDKKQRSDSSESPRFDELERLGAFPIYEFWGSVSRSDVESFETSLGIKPSENHDDDEVEIMCWFANDHILRYARVSKEDRPFVRAMFEETLDSNWGIGVADNLHDVQHVLNGAVRAFEDNKKLSANVILATKARYFEDDSFELKPGKNFLLSEDCQDARAAIQAVQIPDVGQSLINLIDLFNFRFADEFSQIPKISQGIQSKSSITAFEVSQQIESAGKYIGGVVRNLDEYVLEPILNKFLKWYIENADIQIPQHFLKLKTQGYKTFQSKIIRVQKINQILVLTQNPLLSRYIKELSILREIAKSYDIDPDEFIKTDDELVREQQNEAQQIQIQMQQIQLQLQKLQAEIQLLNAKAQSEAEKTKIQQAKLISEIEDKKILELKNELKTIG